jgi:hypothetical protein
MYLVGLNRATDNGLDIGLYSGLQLIEGRAFGTRIRTLVGPLFVTPSSA